MRWGLLVGLVACRLHFDPIGAPEDGRPATGEGGPTTDALAGCAFETCPTGEQACCLHGATICQAGTCTGLVVQCDDSHPSCGFMRSCCNLECITDTQPCSPL